MASIVYPGVAFPMGTVGAVGPLTSPPDTAPAYDGGVAMYKSPNELWDSVLTAIAEHLPVNLAIALLSTAHDVKGRLYSSLMWKQRVERLTGGVYVLDDLVKEAWSAYAYQEEYMRVGWCADYLRIPPRLLSPHGNSNTTHGSTSSHHYLSYPLVKCVTPLDVPSPAATTRGGSQRQPNDSGSTRVGRGGRTPGVVVLLGDGRMLLGNTGLDQFAPVRIPPPLPPVEVCDKWAMVLDPPNGDGTGGGILLYASKRKDRGVYHPIHVETPHGVGIVRAFYHRGRHCVQDATGAILAISKYGMGPARRYVADRTVDMDVLTLDAPTYNPSTRSIVPHMSLVHMGADGKLTSTQGF